jgi:2-polyprenyl-3-methyl-5-hydroxy-6-metoxy-1,4-benzoquinol methylase
VTTLTRRRPTVAGRAALRAYRQLPVGTRLHAAVRWWSAPFPEVVAALPSAGRILEIGCGYGLFCTYAALDGPARSVLGVDIDEARIDDARRVANSLGDVGLTFEVAKSGAVAPGPWDAIVIIDMLYLLPAALQRGLLVEAAAQLAPGGTLLVKEMSTTPKWKARWNTVQETLAVSILGITERAAGAMPSFDFVAPEVMAGWLREIGLSTSQRRLDRHRVHPHHLLIARRAAPVAQ